MKLRNKMFILLCGLSFFTVGFVTLPDYGINWDEPVHYIRGQAFLHFFFTGHEDFNDLPRLRSHYVRTSLLPEPKNIAYEDDRYFRRSLYQRDLDEKTPSYRFFIEKPGSHPPINGELASLFNAIFYQKLGIVGDIESYHLFILFTSTVLVTCVFYFVAAQYGLFAGLISFLSLSLYPLFLSESRFNIKDSVEASFFGLTIIAFYKGVIRNSWKWILVSILCASLALGTKFNAVFLLPIFLSWGILYGWKRIKVLKWPFPFSLSLSLLGFLLIPPLALFVAYPNLWSKPLEGFNNIFSYYKTIGYGTVYQPSTYLTVFNLNTYALQYILFITPLLILFLSLVGFIYSLWYGFKEKNKTALLIVIWFFMPIARVTFPNTGIYGGVRQIMEYIPAMAILSGIGADYIVKKFGQFLGPPKKSLLMIQAIIVLSFIPITLKLISIHPNENVYFNPLIGGLQGAKEKNFADWGVSLGNVYQQGVGWLNTHAEHGANVALVNGLLSNVPLTKLRPDLHFFERHYSGKEKKGEYLMEETDSHWVSDTPLEKRIYIETLRPVHEVKVDGVSILTIWKNDALHTVEK